MDGVLRAHTCAPTTPDSAQPLVSVKVPGFGRMVLGDAPTWADRVQISGPANDNQVTLTRVGDRTFWLAQGPQASPHNVIATCVIGDNCTVVQKWLMPAS